MLRQALAELDVVPVVEEVDVKAPGTAAQLRGWGSPTILVNGKDVAGGQPSGTSCRLYPGSETPGAPSLAALRAALERAT